MASTLYPCGGGRLVVSGHEPAGAGWRSGDADTGIPLDGRTILSNSARSGWGLADLYWSQTGDPVGLKRYPATRVVTGADRGEALM